MFKRVALVILALSVCLTTSLNFESYAAVPADTSYQKLIDYVITDGTTSNGYTYGENLEIVNGGLPIDSNITYNGKSALRVNVTGASDWWESMLTVRDWCSHDFTQYLKNGSLEFDVIGLNGGETFNIGFKDTCFSRTDNKEETSYVSIENYITVSKTWTHVSIPLKDFSANNSDINFKYITCALINGHGKSSQKFWINGIKITSPDLEQSYPEIKVNQIGFVKKSEKYALISGFREELTADTGSTFHVVNSLTEKISYSGKLTLISEYDSRDSGEKVLKADFTDLDTAGTYYIIVDEIGIEKSVKFTISNNAYDNMMKDLLRFYYFQRQGNLDKEYAGNFSRNDVTPDDLQASFATDSSKVINVSKGWYDAGDLGKYVNVGSIAVSDLLWTYESFPEQFYDGQSGIPESGNGIADILDEIRWEIEWILSMQNSQNGGFYPRVQGSSTVRMVMDQKGCTTDDTACAAAALAEAYITYKNIDSVFAARCLAAAEKAWGFLKNNPDNIVATDVYKVSDDSMDRLWASAALYRATPKTDYHDYFKTNYKNTKWYFESSYAYANVWGRMWFTAILDYLKSSDNDSQIVDWLSIEYDKWLTVITDRWEKNAWGNTLPQGNYYWGVNMQIVNIPMGAVLASELLGKENEKVEKFALSSLSWILGANPLHKSFVTGEGEDSISSIHSIIYGNDNIIEVPAGYLPGGPNAVNAKRLSNFAAKCYNESDNDWQTNEHTVYMNSPLVFLTAYAQSMGKNSTSALPGDADSDGNLTYNDLILLKSYVMGVKVTVDIYNTDVNGDMKINSLDIIKLKKLL